MAAAVEVAERAASNAKDHSAKAERERRAAEEHSAESAAALARERADRKADVASFANERKDLQVLCWPYIILHSGLDVPLSSVHAVLDTD